MVLITSPLFNDNYKTDNNNLKEALDDLNFEYHDFSDMFNSNNRIENWKHEVHLSDKGAQIFSKMLNNLLFN